MKKYLILTFITALLLHASILPANCGYRDKCTMANIDCITLLKHFIIHPIVRPRNWLPINAMEVNSTCSALKNSGVCLVQLTAPCLTIEAIQVQKESYEALTNAICNPDWKDRELFMESATCIRKIKLNIRECNPFKISISSMEGRKCFYYAEQYDCIYRVTEENCGNSARDMLKLWLKPNHDFMTIFCGAKRKTAVFKYVTISLTVCLSWRLYCS